VGEGALTAAPRTSSVALRGSSFTKGTQWARCVWTANTRQRFHSNSFKRRPSLSGFASRTVPSGVQQGDTSQQLCATRACGNAKHVGCTLGGWGGGARTRAHALAKHGNGCGQMCGPLANPVFNKVLGPDHA
jgi:hypothetical protein